MYDEFLIERRMGTDAASLAVLIDPVCWMNYERGALDTMVLERLVPVLGILLGDQRFPHAIALVAARADWRSLRSARMRSMERTLLRRQAGAIVLLDADFFAPAASMACGSEATIHVGVTGAQRWVRQSARTLAEASPIVQRAVGAGSLALIGWCHSDAPLQSAVFRVDHDDDVDARQHPG